MKEWFGRNLLKREHSSLFGFWAVCCTMWYANYGWWAIIPLMIGAVICGAMEAWWEHQEGQALVSKAKTNGINE